MHGLHRDGYAPTRYADLERNDAMRCRPSVRPFIRSPWRRRGTPRKRRAHARAYPHTRVHPRAGLRNSERSTRAGGDDIYLRIRRERDPGVSTRRNAHRLSRRKRLLHRKRLEFLRKFLHPYIDCLVNVPHRLKDARRSNKCCERIFNNVRILQFC